ncbi:MAG: C39 family peptidase [Agathobacter sp.]|nr:C39 family peptidase [Agathobacter sp.]
MDRNSRRYQTATGGSRRRRSRKQRQRQIRRIMLACMFGIICLTIFLLWNLFTMIARISMPDGEERKEVALQGNMEEDSSQLLEEIHLDEEVLAGGETTIYKQLQKFADKNDFSVNEYPEELIELIQKNADTEEFVLNYPLKKGTFSRDVLTEYLDTEKVPLFMQWDERWGYYEYGSNVLGLTGCGPTCLSMVALYLLQDPQMTPLYVAEYSVNNGYCVPGSGTSWNLMSEGARGLGLTVREVSLDEEQIRKNLEAGRPIIAIMGAGDFTDQGHFIVFSGWQDGKIVVNDPNSRTNSAKLWSYEDIKSQIRGMWAYKK